MARIRLSDLWILIITYCSCLVRANQVQFYDKGSQYGFALSSTTAGNGTSLLLQLSAPKAFEWVAVGTGNKMDGSLMFMLYPSGSDDGLTLSIRSGSGHDTPEPISTAHANIVKSELNDRMTATIHWQLQQYPGLSNVDPQSKQQAWIWAVGPRQYLSSTDANAEIEQHSSYGVFFADMQAAQSADETSPALTDTANVGTKGQGGSYRALVVLHALLLGVTFLVLFPVGVVGLRWKWSLGFAVHWIVQSIGSAGALVGLAVAIAMTISGVEYDRFDEPHQILGILVVSVLALQAGAGYFHHRKFKTVKSRTPVSHVHIWLGRILIYGGMINAVLGFLLSDSKSLAIGCAVVALLFASGLEFVSFWSRRQRPRGYSKTGSTSNTQLNLISARDGRD